MLLQVTEKGSPSVSVRDATAHAWHATAAPEGPRGSGGCGIWKELRSARWNRFR